MQPNQPTQYDLQDQLHDTLADMPGVTPAIAQQAAYGYPAAEAW